MAELRCAFVTGGDGFVGSHLLRHLLIRGVQVRALTRRGAAAGREDLPVDVEWVTGDLLEPDPWRGRLTGCDALFHVAAFYSPRPEDARQMHAVNVTGTRNVLEAAAAAGVSRVVHTSTIGVVGRPVDGSLPDENTPFNLWHTGSEYVRSKWLGEAAALLWASRGLDVVVVQPTAPVGSGDTKPTATGQRFADFMAGQRPDYPTGGMNLCPVQDIAVGHILAAELGQSGQRYILGHHAGNLSEEAFLALLSDVSGLPVPPAAQRSGGRRPSSLTADPGRAIEELGLPQSSLREAFAAAVATYQ